MTDWLTDWLVKQTTNWLTNKLIDSDWLADWLIDWLTDWLTGWLSGWVTSWVTGPLILDQHRDWQNDWHIPFHHGNVTSHTDRKFIQGTYTMLSLPPVRAPLDVKWSSKYFPNLLELSFITVCAFPRASIRGLTCQLNTRTCTLLADKNHHQGPKSIIKWGVNYPYKCPKHTAFTREVASYINL